MDVLGLIPARAGSRGIPRKNVAPVGGRPLVEWTLDAALGATALSRIVCSTDDPAVATLCADRGVAVIERPADLATDSTPMLDVVAHGLAATGGADAVVLLQPTSPLRTARHVDEAVALFVETAADSVVSVVDVPHAFVPDSLLRLEGGLLVRHTAAGGATRRQDKPRLLARNGPAVLVVAAEVVAGGSLYGARSLPYPMSRRCSVDIDDEDDLVLAAALLREGGG